MNDITIASKEQIGDEGITPQQSVEKKGKMDTGSHEISVNPEKKTPASILENFKNNIGKTGAESKGTGEIKKHGFSPAQFLAASKAKLEAAKQGKDILTPTKAPPPPPPMPPKLQAAPPPPPKAPSLPSTPAQSAPSSPKDDLLAQIRGGAQLKKAEPQTEKKTAKSDHEAILQQAFNQVAGKVSEEATTVNENLDFEQEWDDEEVATPAQPTVSQQSTVQESTPKVAAKVEEKTEQTKEAVTEKPQLTPQQMAAKERQAEVAKKMAQRKAGGGADRGSLLDQIQAGKTLKKAEDKKLDEPAKAPDPNDLQSIMRQAMLKRKAAFDGDE